MNGRMIARVLGLVLLILAALLLLPLLTALVYGESAAPFALTIGIAVVVGAVLTFGIKPESTELYAKEGFAVVGLSWIVMSLLGAVPFVLSGDIPNYLDAVFETASGLTTTGASILTDVESLSRSGMFWRCFTHWIGGMGVLVFVLAIIPLSKGSDESMHLLRAESPGPDVGKVSPTMRKTTRVLYAIYFGITLLTFLLLVLGGDPAFDSFCNAVGAAGTGGFAIKNAGIAAYGH